MRAVQIFILVAPFRLTRIRCLKSMLRSKLCGAPAISKSGETQERFG
jgi:hypothetical protein